MVFGTLGSKRGLFILATTLIKYQNRLGLFQPTTCIIDTLCRKRDLCTRRMLMLKESFKGEEKCAKNLMELCDKGDDIQDWHLEVRAKE